MHHPRQEGDDLLELFLFNLLDSVNRYYEGQIMKLLTDIREQLGAFAERKRARDTLTMLSNLAGNTHPEKLVELLDIIVPDETPDVRTVLTAFFGALITVADTWWYDRELNSFSGLLVMMIECAPGTDASTQFLVDRMTRLAEQPTPADLCATIVEYIYLFHRPA